MRSIPPSSGGLIRRQWPERSAGRVLRCAAILLPLCVLAGFFLNLSFAAASFASEPPAGSKDSTLSGARISLLENPDVSSNIKLLESWIEAQMVHRKIPGMSVGIVYDQELIYARGFGFSDVERKVPADPRTVYRIASITKTFTATAIMQLRDEGKLSLDDPVKKFLPWFRIKSRFADAPEVTIRHLLTHTSGLPRESAFPYWTDHKFPTREEMIEALQNQEAVFPPETRIKYSNLALAVAGEVVFAVSGTSYEEYVRKNILIPLGMKNTSVRLDEGQMGKLATPYSRLLPDGTHKVMHVTDSKGISPAANMSSNV
ncbi:MAG: serine hydrolase domain-containing protein, partial [Candidatus Eisenbacteria bacterium]